MPPEVVKDADPEPVAVAPAPDGALVVGGGGANAFRSVRDALAAAPPGRAHIVLGDRVHEEQLTLTGPLDREIVVESLGAAPATWRLPAAAPSGANLLALDKVGNFRLRNVVLDGGDRAECLVTLAGACPGATFEDVRLTGFNRAAVLLTGCVGGEGKPVLFDRVRFVSLKAAEAALLVDGPEGTRFVEARGCRFFGVADGLHFRPGEARPPLDVRLVNNTFYGLQRGLNFDAEPATAGSRIELTNNLFVKTARLAALAGQAAPPGRSAPWVWYDDGLPKEKETTVPPGTRYFRAAFDVATLPETAMLDLGCAQSARLWLNGQEVARTARDYFGKRVYAFDVKAHVRVGKNVLAVEAVNAADPLNANFLSAAGLVVVLTGTTTGKPTPLATTGPGWKAAKDAPEGWQQPAFDDASWAAVKVWPAGSPLPWNDAYWESVAKAKFGGALPFPSLVSTGNFRDYSSAEGLPNLESKRGFLKDLPNDPNDDATFLRYAKDHKLKSAGPDGSAVGAGE